MEIVRSFYRTREAGLNLTLAETLTYLEPRPGGALLDLGCFDGSTTVLYRDAIRAGRTCGVDLADERLAEAASRGIETLHADLNSSLPLDYPAGSFDVVTCVEVVEHVFSPDDLLDEIARLLKPDGYVLLTTPNLASWKNRILLALGWQPFASEVSTRSFYGNPFTKGGGMPAGHIRLFTMPALLELAAKSGLRPARIGGFAFRSPMRNLIGSLSRTGDALFTRFPSLADRFVICFEKIQ